MDVLQAPNKLLYLPHRRKSRVAVRLKLILFELVQKSGRLGTLLRRELNAVPEQSSHSVVWIEAAELEGTVHLLRRLLPAGIPLGQDLCDRHAEREDVGRKLRRLAPFYLGGDECVCPHSAVRSSVP